MRRRGRWVRACAATGAAAIVLCGCGGGLGRGSTTRFGVADVEYVSERVREELIGARFLEGRSAGSARWLIVPEEPENLSAERIPVADRWAMLSLMLFDPGVQELLNSKNVYVQAPGYRKALFERYQLERYVREHAESDGAGARGELITFAGGGRPETHVFRTTIRSIQRAASEAGGRPADVRKDVYVVEAEIFDARTGEVVWSGSTEFARAARGLLLD